MDPQKPVKIEISGKVNYSDEITVSQAAQIMAFIDSSSGMGTIVPAQATRLSNSVAIASSSTGSASNPREMLDTTLAKTNAEKIVAFAKLVLDDGNDTFTIEDVKPKFRQAREVTPKNLSRDLDTAVRSGWVADADDKGEYFLTKKALDILEVGFASSRESSGTSGTRRSRSTTASKPRKTAVEVPEVFKEVDPIPTNIEGVIDYTKLKQDKDRFLWAIKLGKDLGNDGLSNSEIVWLTDQLGSGIIAKQITSKFDRARSAGHVNRSTQTHRIRITPDGETYLQSLAVAKD